VKNTNRGWTQITLIKSYCESIVVMRVLPIRNDEQSILSMSPRKLPGSGAVASLSLFAFFVFFCGY
jgi:hypothetical protein